MSDEPRGIDHLIERWTFRNDNDRIFGAPALSSPADIAGLKGWYKADAIAQANGSDVATWPDSSAQANNLTDGSGLNPTLQTNVQNGKPVVRFNGTNDRIADTGTDLGITQPNTVVIVGNQTSKATSGRFIDTGGTGRQIVGCNASGLFSIFASSSVTGAVDRSGAFHSFTGVFNGASSVGYVDGVQEFSGNPGSNGLGFIVLGFDQGTTFLTGDLAEICIYQGALSPSNIQLLHNYLAFRWNLPLVASQYFNQDIGKVAYQQDTGQYWRLMSTAPTWTLITGTVGYPSAAGAAGNVLRSDGTNFVSSVLGAADLSPVSGMFVSKLVGVNFNTANSDNPMAIVLPTGYTRWRCHAVVITRPSITMGTATFGLFTATSGGGVAIIPAGAVTTGLTSTAENTNGNMISPALTNNTTTSFNVPTVYFRVGTAQGAAATADVELLYTVHP